MLTIFTVLSGVATAAEPISHRATEVPELASMALLSVVLAGVSVAVRRSGPKAPPRDERRDDADKASEAARQAAERVAPPR